MNVAACGCTRRIALTTVKPSPGWPMFRSDNSTSKVAWLMCSRASNTVADVVTSNPCCCRIGFSVLRIPASSSTNKIRVAMLYSKAVRCSQAAVRWTEKKTSGCGDGHRPAALGLLAQKAHLHVDDGPGRQGNSVLDSLENSYSWFLKE